MKTWKCIICGAVAMSKCPAQRNIHGAGGTTTAILSSLVSAEVIRANVLSEVIFSVTVETEEVSTDTLKSRALSLLLENGDKLGQAYCDHIFVLNSETERECSLGCKHHHNLSDAAELLAGLEKPAKADLKSITRDLCWGLKGMIERARKLNNIDTQKFDREIEGQFQFLKEQMARLTNMGKDVYAFPRYRVSSGYREPAAYFDSLEQLNHYLLCNPIGKFYVEELDYTRERYEVFPFKSTVTCEHCKQEITELYWVQTENGSLHEKCHKKLQDRYKLKNRRTMVQIKETELKESRYWEEPPHFDYWSEMGRFMRQIHDNIEIKFMYRGSTKAGFARFQVSAKCTGEVFEQLCERLQNIND